MEVSVRELKNQLSEYLRRVQAGESFVVTSHGRPVGQLSPPERVADDPEEYMIRQLRAQPWIRAGEGGRVEGSDRPIDWPPDERPLSEVILDDRE